MKKCKCADCKELFVDGRATMDRTYEHTFWVDEKEVSRIMNNNNIPVDRLSFFRKVFNRLLPFSNAPLVAFATVLASSPLIENEDYYIKRMKAEGRIQMPDGSWKPNFNK